MHAPTPIDVTVHDYPDADTMAVALVVATGRTTTRLELAERDAAAIVAALTQAFADVEY